MHQTCKKYKWQNTAKVLLAVLFLVYGCLIYLLFRNRSLNIYQWCIALGVSDLIEYARNLVQGWTVSDFIKYSLPDGLYCAAYILIVDSIWQEEKLAIKLFILFVVPIITICSEILQYYGLIRGTFDAVDLYCYSTPPLVYLGILINNHFMYNNLKSKEL